MHINTFICIFNQFPVFMGYTEKCICAVFAHLGVNSADGLLSPENNSYPKSQINLLDF